MPNSMARGAPRLKTPVPAPTRLVIRVAERGAVNRTGTTRQSARKRVGRQIEVSEVEQVEEADAGLERDDVRLGFQLVGPGELQIEVPKIAHIHLAGRSELQGAVRDC